MDTASLLRKYHNPQLVIKYADPNGNRQIIIFNDGEIMETKGGSAFMERSLFSQCPR